MPENRPHLPAELKRRVLVEAGHRCAIPTCRYIEVEVHHIIPYEQCQTHEYENLIALCPNCHNRADRGDIDRKSLRTYKANLRFAHDKFSQFELDVLFEAAKANDGQYIPIMPAMRLMIKRLLDAGYVHLHTPDFFMSSGGMRVNPDYLVITGRGLEFVSSLGLDQDN